jgi:hypothetical protein
MLKEVGTGDERRIEQRIAVRKVYEARALHIAI